MAGAQHYEGWASRLFASGRDVAPVVLVIAFFQAVILRQPVADVAGILIGLLLVVLGLSFFVHGLETGLFPLGESMAQAFARKGNLAWLLLFAFALGFSMTVAEPALIAITGEAAEVAAADGWIETTRDAKSNYALGLRLTVALSVGTALVIGVLRILKGWPLPHMIIGGYIIVVILTGLAPPQVIAVAYDSGGVTTSTITVPLVTALGVGLASSIRGRNPMLDGFGLIAFACLLPIIFVMGYGMLL